jgi:hypothetical protein
MPQAKLWVLLNPGTRFAPDEAQKMIAWVRGGGTLVWADASGGDRDALSADARRTPALDILRRTAGVQSRIEPYFHAKVGLPLPPLGAAEPGAASIYRSGVATAGISGDGIEISQPYLPILSAESGSALARIDVGAGRIFVTPDALLWTNMALAQNDNAILVTNIVRAHTRRGDLVVWDERAHDAPGARKITPSLLYFLWQPPLRWAVLQILAAGLLLALFCSRRLGRAVPLSSPPNALRASQWALAMSSLFQKVERPHVAALTSGEHFRRQLARRVGLSPGESDEVLAQRATQASGLDHATLDRLLMRSRTPASSPEEMLRDIQQMERVLQELSPRR